MEKYEFFDKLYDVEFNSKWIIITGKELEIQQSFGMIDPLQGSKTLFMSANIPNSEDFAMYPIHYLAYSGLQTRAGFQSAEFFNSKNVDYEDKVYILNKGLQYCNPNKEIKVLIRDGYYLAFHSQKYVPVRQDEIFEKITSKLEDNYDCEFIDGVYGLEKTFAMYKLGYNSQKTIEKKLTRHKYSYSNINVYLDVVTSDVTLSGINIFPKCIVDGIVLPLASAIKAPHLGENPLEKVIEKIDNLIPTIDIGIEKIMKLQKIELEYPVRVTQALMKRLQISKKIREGLQEELDYTFGTEESTAFDVFLFLAQYLLDTTNKEQGENLELENKIANISNMSEKEFFALDLR